MSDHDPEDPRDEELRELIEEALKLNINQQKTFKDRKSLINSVAGYLEEYLDSFILLAYDMNGNPITIKNTQTTQQNEALRSMLISYFASEIGRV
tara:strand:+ start:646 stop:930 length:285 start_codon:yes stop_codon:yes gene_type:complete